MACHEQSSPLVSSDQLPLTIALAGNPNCGKTALFNTLTGIRQRTGNWPGVTVDRKEGRFTIDSEELTVVDLPGIYLLDALSLDEKVTRDYLLSGDADLIVNIVDASNLERNLYFSVQMLEMGVPLLLALNMMDVARKRGIEIDVQRLSQDLGCPVVPIVAVSGEGLTKLKRVIQDLAAGAVSGGFALAQDELVEQAIMAMEPALPVVEKQSHSNRRWLLLKMLEGDRFALDHSNGVLLAQVHHWQEVIEDWVDEDLDIHIADTRYGHAHAISQNVTQQRGRVEKTLSDRIDKVVLSRLFGIPVFLAVMYLMFMFAINIGGAFIDFFDGLAGAVFVDGFGHLLSEIGLPSWLIVLLADGAGGGIQVVVTFIPIITALYLFLSVVEDSGYMARAAFVMDRFMRSIGLPGKAFVPMIVGFGCNVPAVMATRTLESERERKLTILMNPFMSCGARLPVYVLFATAFFPVNGQNLVFTLYLIGIMVAILTGLIMKKTLLSGESAGFMMELPHYHMPTVRGVMLRTLDRVKLFIKEAGRVIVLMVLVINTLNSIGTDGSFGNEDTEHSLLSTMSKAVTPLLAPMGIHQDNWPATVGVFTGILAKETVLGTLDALYTHLASDEARVVESGRSFDFWQSIGDATATVLENLLGIKDLLTDPLAMNVGDISSAKAAALAQAVNIDVFGAMAARFDGQAGAFAYLLFILLYSPCVATIGAICREAGPRWATFVVAWSTGIAFISASLFYQMATYADHPQSALVWIIGLIALLVAIIGGLRYWSLRSHQLISEVGA
ncbi:MAG: Fe(2+) transporter permease subunit FeoB [Candidatus Thiodiazotropha sp. (ex Lucinoma aequizonata)]|nr:Fe(2+) transporter permease subunit FeoB [Candidatus Thiodiazotropha sp. (ex Lucinoma aequizonata)]MCU7887481.1 Fe(2+) transporter permease subunit FeoB [Candidatus Thiodiazotropha sp. (ex Lucinoma aequizonata)]MCU7895209.1 Fe(2+) transporter permease subunit FeoB [Candidatus Thiodiazotropha sp. (ex Lucinoma aequizonata)]MCU7897949.1 Fe(2+) transporter permease subunit FeoB [Candidatus Thiodiazotropha sp. (ex Lucinoma aequizonata)]MCU7903609.1 Fe(2+) transporter permease subunit FeoB [Candid